MINDNIYENKLTVREYRIKRMKDVLSKIDSLEKNEKAFLQSEYERIIKEIDFNERWRNEQ